MTKLGNSKISVIVPVYKVEKYLDRCVESIVNQTYKNLEIILVDDGSPDNCPEMCDVWANKDERIKVIHKENGGVSSARNRGIDAATGDYIGFVDSDDWIEPDMYELLADNAKKYDADISRCGYFVDWSDHTAQIGNGGILLYEDIERRCEMLRSYHLVSALWNKIYRRELFEEERLDESLRITEDWQINYRLIRKCKTTVYNDICKYHYIMHDGSATKSYNRNSEFDMLKTVQYFEIQENGEKKTEHDFICGYMSTVLTIINHMIRNHDTKCEEFKYAVQCFLKYKSQVIFGDFAISFKIFVILILINPSFYGFIYLNLSKARKDSSK